MDVFQVFATDEVAESEGRWFPLSKTAKVLVARTGNQNYIKALRERMKSHQIDTSDESAETEELVTSLVVETMAETILLGWKGLQYRGAEMEYTRANARTLLGVKEFRKKINALADSADSFRIREEAEQGND